jgi:hypothetical protein
VLSSLGLDDDDDDEDGASAVPDPVPGLNFYCDASSTERSPSQSSSSPDLSDHETRDNLAARSNTPVRHDMSSSGGSNSSSSSSSPVDAIDNEDATETKPSKLADEEFLRRASMLEETIEQMEQQMAEANDSMFFEMRMKKREDRVETSKSLSPSPSPSKKRHKIKVRVEQEKPLKLPRPPKDVLQAPKKPRKDHHRKSASPDKAMKIKTADAVVKVLVPYFKQGMVGSKEIFKFMARELTHTLLKHGKVADDSNFNSHVDKFFGAHGIVCSESDAKKKIALFEESL